MRITDTYKGFVYQKKCALLLLLRELADQTGAIAFRMEHPQGDDFDLVYKDKLNIYQTKDEQTPNLPVYLTKMWRRYTENMRPPETRLINLGFLFSKDHRHDNPCYTALYSGKVTSRHLTSIRKTVNSDPKTENTVKSAAEWINFLRPITVKVLTTEEVEFEILGKLRLLFYVYNLSDAELESLAYEFLGRLDEIMQSGRQVQRNEVRQVIEEWFIRHCDSHPTMRKSIQAIFAAKCMRLSSIDTQTPSVTGSELIP